MSTWVISLLVILVAIPLIFMGLGDYQSPSKTYAMKINDQLITNSQLDQEIYQYKQALQENFGGQIPPIYTDKFIRQLTINYMMRSILMDQMSKKIGLAYHNDSILENIYNTSAFRDEKGFNNNLYKSQLFRLNTTPEAYERYIYQKGIKDQLQNSITETSLFTKLEKKNLSKYRFQQRDISYKIIEKSSFDKNIDITEKELIEYYESNKNMFIEPLSAQFSYIDVSRDEIISNIEPDFIFHLAAQPLVSVSYSDPLFTLKTNVLGTANILNSIKDQEKKIVSIIITSDKCYDNLELTRGYNENDILGGKDIYSGSKGAAELVIKSFFHSFFKNHKFNSCIASARAGNVIGGGDWGKDRIVPDAVTSWSKDEKLSMNV